MTQRIRRIFFWAFAAIFVSVGAYLVLLTQGIVMDFSRLHFVKTGAIVLRPAPVGEVLVTLNGKLFTKDNSFLGKTISFDRLIPGNYKVAVKKNGYVQWEKELEVKPGMVTKDEDLILFPETLKESFLAKNALGFSLTKQGLVIQNKNGTLTLDDSSLRGTNVVLSNLNSAFIVTASGNARFATELGNPKTSLNVQDLFTSLKERQLGFPGVVPIQNIFIHPFSEDKLLLMTRTSLYALDLKKVALDRLYTTTSSVSGIAVSKSEAFIADSKGRVAVLNLILNSTSFFVPSVSSTIVSIAVNPSGNYVFLKTAEGGFYAYDRAKTETVLLPVNPVEFSVSNDGHRLIFLSADGKIGTFYLSDYEDVMRVETIKKGSLEFILAQHIFSDFLKFPDSDSYALARSENDLFVVELRSGTPNTALLARDVDKYAFDGKSVVTKKMDGTITKIELNY